MTNIVIYHADCQDGFGAAYAAWTRMGGNATYISAHHGNPPPDVTGADVFILDFSYPPDVLEKMAQSARSILVIDHHKTAKEGLSRYSEPDFTSYTDYMPWIDDWAGRPVNLTHTIFDMSKSGAVLAWEFFQAGKPVPLLLQHIQDRDLWAWKLPETKKILSAFKLVEHDFDIWHVFVQDFNDNYIGHTLITEGQTIPTAQDKMIDEIIKSSLRFVKFGDVDIKVVNSPILQSEIGDRLAPGEPFVAIYYDTDGARKFSLRSTDQGMDVSKIAKEYGGGGHRNAAGFKAPIGWMFENDHIISKGYECDK